LTEELITALSKIGALKVISRTSIMRYKRANKPLPEIAQELNASGIIEGSVLSVGNRVRVTAQLSTPVLTSTFGRIAMSATSRMSSACKRNWRVISPNK
jgi:hypothetical protein